MKESPDPNYYVELRDAFGEFLPGFEEHLPGAFVLTINRVVSVAILPSLPRAPWPPPFPSNWEALSSRDESAHFAFATKLIAVAPSADEQLHVERVVFAENDEQEHTAFWIPETKYTALQSELSRLLDRPQGGSLRRSELGATELAWFLDELLPQAALSDYKRKILCLE